MRLKELTEDVDISELPLWASLANKALAAGKPLYFNLYKMQDVDELVSSLEHIPQHGIVKVHTNDPTTRGYTVRSDDYWRWTITKYKDGFYLHLK